MNRDVMKTAAEKSPEAIAQPFDTIVRSIGFDATVFFMDVIGQGMMYMPSPRFVFWECVKESIRDDSASLTIKEICRHYGVNRQTVSNIINEAI